MENKERILKQIAESAEISKKIAEDCKKYCTDESIPVADRWEVFTVAPNKGEGGWVDEPPEDIIGFECIPYDDFHLERRETFDVVDRLKDWEVDAEKAAAGEKAWGFGSRLTPEMVDKLKNYYMLQYKGSWIYDW